MTGPLETEVPVGSGGQVFCKINNKEGRAVVLLNNQIDYNKFKGSISEYK